MKKKKEANANLPEDFDASDKREIYVHMTFGTPITVRNEKMMHKAIIKFMTVALKGYSTTIEED